MYTPITFIGNVNIVNITSSLKMKSSYLSYTYNLTYNLYISYTYTYIAYKLTITYNYNITYT
jgi:hypothetical protein